MEILIEMSKVAVIPAVALACGLLGLLLGMWIGRRLGNGASSGNGNGGQGDRGGPVELYVGNLSFDTDEKNLARAFGRCGSVHSVRIISKKSDGQSKGYGFVEMEDRDGAEAAVKEFNGKELAGRVLVVNEARTRSKSQNRR